MLINTRQFQIVCRRPSHSIRGNHMGLHVGSAAGKSRFLFVRLLFSLYQMLMVHPFLRSPLTQGYYNDAVVEYFIEHNKYNNL